MPMWQSMEMDVLVLSDLLEIKSLGYAEEQAKAGGVAIETTH